VKELMKNKKYFKISS